MVIPAARFFLDRGTLLLVYIHLPSHPQTVAFRDGGIFVTEARSMIVRLVVRQACTVFLFFRSLLVFYAESRVNPESYRGILKNPLVHSLLNAGTLTDHARL